MLIRPQFSTVTYIKPQPVAETGVFGSARPCKVMFFSSFFVLAPPLAAAALFKL